MISITLTGNTIDEVGGQALALVMKLAGAQNVPGPGIQQPLPPPIDPALDNYQLAEQPLPVEVVNVGPQTMEAASPRKRRTRAEIDAANAAAQKAGKLIRLPDEIEAAEEPLPEPTPVEIVEALAAPTFDDLKRALNEVCETNGAGVAAARLLMAEFCPPPLAPRISLIAEDRYPEFMERARAVVAGARK